MAEPAPVVGPTAVPASQVTWTAEAAPRHNAALLVLYGSNMGTSAGLAQQIAGDGEANGYVTTVTTLDEYVGKLPQAGGDLIVTSSYDGRPSDNAGQVCEWLASDGVVDACRGVATRSLADDRLR